MTKPPSASLPSAASSLSWLNYAARMREAVLAREVEKEAARVTTLGEHAAALDGQPAVAAGTVAPALTHRQHLIILQLAATLRCEGVLAAAFAHEAITAVTDVPYDLVHDLVALLPAAMPAGWTTAKSARNRPGPGGVIIVEPSLSRTKAKEDLERELEVALCWRAPVLMLLPEDVALHDVLSDAQVTVWPFHPINCEIIVELLSLSWPDTDQEALRERLPPDDRLAVMPLLPLTATCRSASSRIPS